MKRPACPLGARRGLGLLVAIAVASGACAGGAAAIDRKTLEGRRPINPTTKDGRPIHLGFGHHPDCFVLAEGGAAETLPCPDVAMVRLASCPSGLLYLGEAGPGQPGPGEAGGCICAPVDGGEAQRVDCPRD